jgi:hypothetical protein
MIGTTARAGQFSNARSQYLYGDRPLPEPVLREFQGIGEGVSLG